MFSRLERTKTEITIKITKRTGISITTEMCCDTRKKYTTNYSILLTRKYYILIQEDNVSS